MGILIADKNTLTKKYSFKFNHVVLHIFYISIYKVHCLLSIAKTVHTLLTEQYPVSPAAHIMQSAG